MPKRKMGVKVHVTTWTFLINDHWHGKSHRMIWSFCIATLTVVRFAIELMAQARAKACLLLWLQCFDILSSSFRHAMHIISVVRMWKQWLGAQFARSDSPQIHLRLSSSICRLRFTSDSNQNHFKFNHFKLESKLFQTQFIFLIA